ncbi:MAG TPA: orotate phosphoribosyltransferase [Rikenellaceae bacterium]|jgi:orotate phosphoribosyltransferase|nr:MAG: orotate phosphoribosyltransferase [Bacteroidetes bacterium GWE2_40_15]PKP05648.1 MAG: orotate phosphoribosyltransferase [Bacteroidetes bacterium HGW-Bacteroidetes-5]HBZ26094.1 orotate phosphoribosyltransferase [Rikenellaceae bacterium]
MESTEKIVAKQLLEIKAVMLNVEKPFTWASGWKSPIYCDNRKILSYPKARKIIYKGLVRLIEQNYENVDVIAGVATGAIAWGMLVAEALGKPFIYVRPKPKEHGTGSQIEGELPLKANVVVVEDLISTGGSSLSAVEALNKAGANVLGMVAIFSYNFNKSRRAFEYGNVELRTLTNYDTLINEAVSCKYIANSDLETLQDWRYQPEVWGNS